MQNRIDRLEGLVLSLMTNGNQSAGPAAALAAISGESSVGSTGLSNELDIDEYTPDGAEESDTEQVTKSFGVMKVDNNKSYYISEAHWASVLNDVSATLKTDDSTSDSFLHNRYPRFETSSQRIRNNLKSKRRRSRQPAHQLMFPSRLCYSA